MQVTLTELLGFFGIIFSIISGLWLIADRVARLDKKMDEVSVYIRQKKNKHARRKH